MPPGDSIIYLSDTTGMSPGLKHIIDSLSRSSQNGGYAPMEWVDRPRYPFPEWVLFLLVLAGMFLLFMLYVGIPHLRKQKALKTPVLEELGADALRYSDWLKQYNPYFASLSKPLQERFLDRVVKFMWSKEFRYHKLEPDEMIPVLISGAAVQLTFGLANFLMDYFNVIHVIRKEYILHHDNETYYGHVSRNGIYISWDHFARGYLDYTDGVNVGLHEMAHAVSYDVFLGYQDRHDRGFKKRLQEFRIEGGPVFRAMKQSNHDLLDSYAATNFDEFWAVCIETFFETPESFRDEEPDLYATICELLNQDPARPDKIIDRKLAGIRP